MNKSLLIGRLVENPELVTTANDKSVVHTTIAVNRRFRNSEGERVADFISLVVWGKTAENFVSYAKKGSLLSVEGEIRTHSYEDKQKQRHYVTEVLCTAYSLLESKAAVALREGSVSNEEMVLAAEELPF
ncbi:MAG: single-stranded DNA-binding protein [Streptococcaceae bacterium]|jgi:single-strand DNA-binding protein|nr:single-stranded DNA-binding protein [Streptococcaceae bacterium]